MILRILLKYLVYSAFAVFYGLVGAGVSTFYEEKLVAGFAASSTAFFVQVLISHLIHWDEAVKEIDE